jgi:hypothetical protein
MSAVATTFTKFQIGAAASAIAAAAVLTPAVVAHAVPAAPLPQSLGSSLGSILCGLTGSTSCTPTSPDGILSNPLLWVGTPDKTPPPTTTILSFQPLSLLPGFVQPLFGWFKNINLEVCVAGAGVKVGPYGTVSVSLGAGC